MHFSSNLRRAVSYTVWLVISAKDLLSRVFHKRIRAKINFQSGTTSSYLAILDSH